MNTFKLNTGELAFCIGLSAEIGRGVEGVIPSGSLKVNDNNKPFIDAILERREAVKKREVRDG
jgi:hypothetical protein